MIILINKNTDEVGKTNLIMLYLSCVNYDFQSPKILEKGERDLQRKEGFRKAKKHSEKTKIDSKKA